jgi:hypothetical protein
MFFTLASLVDSFLTYLLWDRSSKGSFIDYYMCQCADLQSGEVIKNTPLKSTVRRQRASLTQSLTFRWEWTP